MRITAIMPTQPVKNPPRRYRAQMSVRHNDHAVTDSVTGERFDLEPEAAWKKFEEINRKGFA